MHLRLLLKSKEMSEAAIITAITVIGGLLSLITKELFAMRKDVKQVHTIINSRMDELLALTKKDSKAEGKEEARVEQVQIDKDKDC